MILGLNSSYMVEIYALNIKACVKKTQAFYKNSYEIFFMVFVFYNPQSGNPHRVQ